MPDTLPPLTPHPSLPGRVQDTRENSMHSTGKISNAAAKHQTSIAYRPLCERGERHMPKFRRPLDPGSTQTRFFNYNPLLLFPLPCHCLLLTLLSKPMPDRKRNVRLSKPQLISSIHRIIHHPCIHSIPAHSTLTLSTRLPSPQASHYQPEGSNTTTAKQIAHKL